MNIQSLVCTDPAESAAERSAAGRLCRAIYRALPAIVLLGCGCSDSGQRAAAASGPAWVDHSDPAGFRVSYPEGWSTEVAKDGRLLIHSADRTVLAVVLPFQAPNGGSSAEWIGPILKHMSTLFPGAEVANRDHVSEQPDESVAKVTYAGHGGDGQANVLCCMSGQSGIFYAIAAPHNLFSAKRATLMRILGSLKPASASTAGTPNAAPASSGPVTYTTWKDPNEGAFTVEVPRGWKVTGGLFRFAPVDVRPQVETGLPRSGIHVQLGDAGLSTFAPPGPSSAMRGLHEGQSYSVNGVPYVVMRYLSGPQFSRQYVQAKIGKQHPDVSIGDTKDLPELAEDLNRRLSQAGSQTPATVGETSFTYVDSGKTVHGVCIARTQLIGQGLGAVWTAFPSTAVAEDGSLGIARGVMEHMLLHTKDDPQWGARAQQTAREFSQLVMANHERAIAELHRIYARFTQQMAENQRQWSNILNNEVDVRNPSTGETYKAQAGYNYYGLSAGRIVGSSEQMGVDVTPLAKF